MKEITFESLLGLNKEDLREAKKEFKKFYEVAPNVSIYDFLNPEFPLDINMFTIEKAHEIPNFLESVEEVNPVIFHPSDLVFDIYLDSIFKGQYNIEGEFLSDKPVADKVEVDSSVFAVVYVNSTDYTNLEIGIVNVAGTFIPKTDIVVAEGSLAISKFVDEEDKSLLALIPGKEPIIAAHFPIKTQELSTASTEFPIYIDDSPIKGMREVEVSYNLNDDVETVTYDLDSNIPCLEKAEDGSFKTVLEYAYNGDYEIKSISFTKDTKNEFNSYLDTFIEFLETFSIAILAEGRLINFNVLENQANLKETIKVVLEYITKMDNPTTVDKVLAFTEVFMAVEEFSPKTISVLNRTMDEIDFSDAEAIKNGIIECNFLQDESESIKDFIGEFSAIVTKFAKFL